MSLSGTGMSLGISFLPITTDEQVSSVESMRGTVLDHIYSADKYMKQFIFAFTFALLAMAVEADTLTNCVRIGNTVNCTSQSREAANTPPSYQRLGSKSWCLVSNAPIKKFFCSYDSYDSCMVAANIDNLRGPVSSCIQNTAYQERTTREVSGNSESGYDPIKAAWVAYKNGDYQTASRIFLANEHVPLAQLALGIMYTSGYGVPKDLGQAKNWLLRAKQSGVAEASEFLKELESESSEPLESPTQRYDKREGEHCSIHSECIDMLKCRNGTCSQPTKIGSRCESSDECDGRAYCKESRCVERERTPLRGKTVSAGAACSASFECSGALVCHQGQCQPMGNQCRNNSDCTASNICRSGYCLAK